MGGNLEETEGLGLDIVDDEPPLLGWLGTFWLEFKKDCMSVSMRDLKKHENGGTMCFAEP